MLDAATAAAAAAAAGHCDVLVLLGDTSLLPYHSCQDRKSAYTGPHDQVHPDAGVQDKDAIEGAHHANLRDQAHDSAYADNPPSHADDYVRYLPWRVHHDSEHDLYAGHGHDSIRDA